jgi:TolB-like protein/tetratricopeptide (TPR) repeat protein
VELPHFVHWLHELRRRHVRRIFRALVAYGIVAFALVEITHPVTVALHLPEWVLTFVVLVLALGFPVVAILAWASGAAAPGVAEPAEGAARRRLDPRLAVVLVVVGLLVAAPGVAYYFLRGTGEARTTGAAGVPSIAVLPFADLSASRDQEYFADGMADEILNALGQIEGLRVPGRASSFFFKGKTVKLADVGRELGVATVLEGSVRKEGNRVRISADVVETASGRRVWSETYDRELTGVFAVQEDIARSVVDALRVKLLPGRGPTVAKGARTNPEAYNDYLLGRHYFDLGNTDGFRRAVDAFEKALAADPGYAPAWAWLATALLNFTRTSEGGVAPAGVSGALERALAAADRSVALGPDVPEAHSARGWMRAWITWDWAGAQSDLQRALELSPRDANTLLRQGFLLALLGRFPAAIATTRKAADIDPLQAWTWFFLAYYYDASGRFDLAEEAATHALDLAPQHLLALRELGVARLLHGDPAAALATFRRHPWDVARLTGTALAQHDLGNAAEEQKALDELRTRFGERAAFEIAEVHAWRGDRDRAFEWLERSYAQHNLNFRTLKATPLLKNIRGDPRYAPLLARIGLPPD